MEAIPISRTILDVHEENLEVDAQHRDVDAPYVKLSMWVVLHEESDFSRPRTSFLDPDLVV